MNFTRSTLLLMLALVIGRVVFAVRAGSITIKKDRIERGKEPRLFFLTNLTFCSIALVLIVAVSYPAIAHVFGEDLSGAAILASIGTVPALTAAAASEPRLHKEGAAELATNVFGAVVGVIIAAVCFIAAAFLALKSIS